MKLKTFSQTSKFHGLDYEKMDRDVNDFIESKNVISTHVYINEERGAYVVNIFYE